MERTQSFIFQYEIFGPLRVLIRANAPMRSGASGLVCRTFPSQGAHPEASTSNIIVRWNAPPPGAVKLNFDGSLSYSSAAGGFIIRDWSGHLIKAGAAHYGESSILIAEARALRDGVKVVAELRVKHLFIEGDNATVIRAL